MMYNPDEIIQKNDLIKLAEQAGAEFHKNGSEWRSFCPLHGGDNKGAFAVYIDNGKQLYKCFTRDECGSGDVIKFVEKWQNISFIQACDWLGGDKTINQEEQNKIIEARAINEIKRLEDATNKALQVLSELRQTQSWLKYHQVLENDRSKQALWELEGIPIEWQNYWSLGYCNSFNISTPEGLHVTPTMTIPIFTGKKWDIQNIKHRLINPYITNDKYRPERPGLQSSSYYCDPELMYDAERILIVEGEKKAMVTYLTLGSNDIQVIGLPGKNQWKSIVNNFNGQTAYVWLDPDAYTDAVQFTKLINGRVINVAMKIDDAINDGVLTKRGIYNLLSTSRKVK